MWIDDGERSRRMEIVQEKGEVVKEEEGVAS